MIVRKAPPTSYSGKPAMSLEWVIHTHTALSSTQDLAKDLAGRGAPEGLVIHALEQTGGHGRHGRSWESPRGNLYLSLVLRPVCLSQVIGQLSLLSAVALAQALEGVIDDPAALMLKWPNDVLLGGRKCAGLLLETSLGADGAAEWVVVGAGVNLKSAPLDTACAVQDYTLAELDIERFRDDFLQRVETLYEGWQQRGFEDLRVLWLEKAHPKGAALSVKIAEHLENGVFHDIDALGNLMLRKQDGAIKTIGAGEVYLY